MITPVLLCGGSGTRLWPLSRKSYPKQFTDILGGDTLFQAAANRFRGEGFSDPLVVTDNAFRFIVLDQLEKIGLQPAGVLIEPEGRNTAPAAIAAALQVSRDDPQAKVLLVPSDHAVPDAEAFRAAVQRAANAADEGQIVTFGITPTTAETGYGWLEAGEETQPGIRALSRFIEKPDAVRAEALLADPRSLWNSGVFLARADTLVTAFRTHAPAILEPVEAALDNSRTDLGFTRLDPGHWQAVPEQSIDYAVMEKADNVSVAPFDGHWTDLGSWEAVWHQSEKDETGNALSENVTAFDCENTLLRSESPELELVGIGLKNLVAVAMHDAVIVADMNDSQHVKQAVSVLKERGAKQAQQFPVDHRPWGWFERLVLGDRFQVKRIHVYPGAALSLQSHHHRSEHWIVVQGTARVTLNGEVRLVTENESIYIPIGAAHRLENPGKVAMVLIEVQTGSYLGEDDIIRHEDIYARGDEPET